MTCLIVGIAGGSASGKSTFVKALYAALVKQKPALRIKVLNVDRYFLAGKQEMPTYYSPSFGREMPDYNQPDALDHARLGLDLDALAAEGAFDILLVEGHLVFSIPEIRERFDLRVFIDLDGEQRALRRLVRNLGKQGDPLPDHSAQSIANYYLESAQKGYRLYIEPSRQHADLILRGDGDFERSGAHVAAVVLAEWQHDAHELPPQQ